MKAGNFKPSLGNCRDGAELVGTHIHRGCRRSTAQYRTLHTSTMLQQLMPSCLLDAQSSLSCPRQPGPTHSFLSCPANARWCIARTKLSSATACAARAALGTLCPPLAREPDRWAGVRAPVTCMHATPFSARARHTSERCEQRATVLPAACDMPAHPRLPRRHQAAGRPGTAGAPRLHAPACAASTPPHVAPRGRASQWRPTWWPQPRG